MGEEEYDEAQYRGTGRRKSDRSKISSRDRKININERDLDDYIKYETLRNL